MPSQALAAKLQEQVKHEWESEYYYLTMMAWCTNNAMDGFANWFRMQAQEEHGHGEKFLKYLAEIDCDISIPSIVTKQVEFKSIEQLFDLSLEHEKKVTGLICNLVKMAEAEKDYMTLQFLQYFIAEQREEESTVRDIVNKLRRLNGAPGGMFYLESHLGKRA